jgi:hypothetical protein
MVSALLGQSAQEMSGVKVEVLHKVPALEHELETTMAPPRREREQEKDMAMEMGM